MTSDARTQIVVVGRIVDAYGLKGQVKVRSFTERPESLLDYPDWILSGAGFHSTCYHVSNAQFDGRFVIASLIDVTDRNQALDLKGADIGIRKDALPQLAEGEFYWLDLIGMKVVNMRGEQLGVVTQLLETGANDVLIVEGKIRSLLPYIPQVVKNINEESGTIKVDWSEDP